MAGPVRLLAVPGYQGRANDIVYMSPKLNGQTTSSVVFFGGDVQSSACSRFVWRPRCNVNIAYYQGDGSDTPLNGDFPENMTGHRDNKQHIKWNLENMAFLLQSQFESDHIIVVRPARLAFHKLATFMEFLSPDQEQRRMEFKVYGCFDNFVPSSGTGCPEYTPNHFSLHHFQRILQSVSARLKQDLDMDVQLDKGQIKLIGFSKGCVVLNQFIYEFHYMKTLTPDDETLSPFIERFTEMYWLDGGHAGGKNTWITSKSLLGTLARLGIKIHIHVTPYQICDDRRPWIRKEERAFSEGLIELGADVHRVVHFENQVPNLKLHFDILTAYRQEVT